MGGVGRQVGVESEQWPGDLSFHPYPPLVITVHFVCNDTLHEVLSHINIFNPHNNTEVSLSLRSSFTT